MNLRMGELKRMGHEVCLDKHGQAKSTELSGDHPNAPAARGVHYAAYEWMACDDFNKLNKDKTLTIDAFIAQDVARRADLETEREKRSSTVRSPIALAENGRLLTPNDMHLGFRKATTATWQRYGEHRESNGNRTGGMER